TKKAPHRVIEAAVSLLPPSPIWKIRDPLGHGPVEPGDDDHPRLERIHVQIVNQDGILASLRVLILDDLPSYFSGHGLLILGFSAPDFREEVNHRDLDLTSSMVGAGQVSDCHISMLIVEMGEEVGRRQAGDPPDLGYAPIHNPVIT